MQENRSFDHYYGTMSSVRGFSDPNALPGVFRTGRLPARRRSRGNGAHGAVPPPEQFPTKNGDCTNDITHEWGPQHQCWDNGAMDQWVNVHMMVDGTQNFVPTMGYFQRSDLPFITRWPTRSPSATATSARCSGRPTRTVSWRCRGPSIRTVPEAVPCS